MKILCFSEHFHPRVGGTVEYVSQTCAALGSLGHELHLVVPGTTLTTEILEGYPYQVTAMGVGWPAHGDPDRQVRYAFCAAANAFALEQAAAGHADVIHVLFGLFLNETLATEDLARMGVPCVNTVHNVPPQECGRSWPGDALIHRLKDSVRLQLVDLKNRSRLAKHPYTHWVVPSEIVGHLLTGVLPDARITVIGHGCSEKLLAQVTMPRSRCPSPGGPMRILTVGGWVPHKRQHLIPGVARMLHQAGIEFVWDMVGPSARVPRYQSAIISDISRCGMHQQVRAHGAVPFEQLARFYAEANLYVQPSTEEGFCMTALDAAALGLPVIGCHAGALPVICHMSGGTPVPSDSSALAEAIRHFYATRRWPENAGSNAHAVRETFNWFKATEQLSQLYQELQQQVSRKF